MRPVGDETLQLADGHGLELDAEHAAAFALGLLRADAAAHGGQRTVAGDDFRRGGEFTFSHFRDEARDIDAYGAGAHAARVLAMQAAGGLQLRFFGVVAVAHFFKIGRADLGILFPDGNAGDSFCHGYTLPILHS